MQFNSMRISVVLGLYVSLRVVKNEGVTNTETIGFSNQPANQSPTRAPPNSADTKFPVTHFFFHPHFQDVPREVPLQTPCTMELLTHHFQKCLLQLLSSGGTQHCASFLTLYKPWSIEWIHGKGSVMLSSVKCTKQGYFALLSHQVPI